MEPKIIKGWVHQNNLPLQGSCRTVTFFPELDGKKDSDHHAILLVSQDGEEPRVWTEKQIIAVLEDMRAWISPDDHEEGQMWSTRAKKHGINLPKQ
jgi:hypothetical protein